MAAVLCFSGVDPSGGAGLIADIETLHHLGVTNVAIPTAMTAQNSHQAQGFWPTEPVVMRQMIDTLLADKLPITVIKIGMIGNLSVLEQILYAIEQLPNAKVVYDPVLLASAGNALVEPELQQPIGERLLPLCELITPNHYEQQVFAPFLIAIGHQNPPAQLLTGGHGQHNQQIISQLKAAGYRTAFIHPRLAVDVRGTGCMLSSAIAGYLCLGQGLRQAIQSAHQFAHHAIRQSYDFGQGSRRAMR